MLILHHLFDKFDYITQRNKWIVRGEENSYRQLH